MEGNIEGVELPPQPANITRLMFGGGRFGQAVMLIKVLK
jgi:hypothetical protein